MPPNYSWSNYFISNLQGLSALSSRGPLRLFVCMCLFLLEIKPGPPHDGRLDGEHVGCSGRHGEFYLPPTRPIRRCFQSRFFFFLFLKILCVLNSCSSPAPAIILSLLASDTPLHHHAGHPPSLLCVSPPTQWQRRRRLKIEAIQPDYSVLITELERLRAWGGPAPADRQV